MKDRAPPRHQTKPVSGPIYAEQLFVEHARFVSSFVHRLGVREADVDDVVQEVFVVAHQKGGYLPGPATPRSWLGAIAVRVAGSARRATARRREDYDTVALERTEYAGGSPSEAVEVAESLLRVQRALDTLDEEHRSVFLLYEVAGEDCCSIAAALDVPVGTVYSRLHHARKRFIREHEVLERIATQEVTP